MPATTRLPAARRRAGRLLPALALCCLLPVGAADAQAPGGGGGSAGHGAGGWQAPARALATVGGAAADTLREQVRRRRQRWAPPPAAVPGAAVRAAGQTPAPAAADPPRSLTGPISGYMDFNPVFDRRPVPLFSDLLLHDVGTGDGIGQAAARPREIRTPALWGLRHRRPLLHDGSAATPLEAAVRHGGEAQAARDRLAALGARDLAALLAFLDSL